MANPTAAQLKTAGLTLAQFNALPSELQQNILNSMDAQGHLVTAGSITRSTVGMPDPTYHAVFTQEEAQAQAEQDYLNSQADQISSVSPHGGALLGLSNAVGNSGVAKAIGNAGATAVGVAGDIAGALTSPFGWIKELFSAQLWDRILFVLGGVALVIIGLVFMLHKTLPTPL